jgi:hypothetical protein
MQRADYPYPADLQCPECGSWGADHIRQVAPDDSEINLMQYVLRRRAAVAVALWLAKEETL